MSGSSRMLHPNIGMESSEKVEDRLRITREEIAWAKREMETVRDRIDFAGGAQWSYALRRPDRDESMAAHAGKTLAFCGLVEAVKRRQQKALKKLADEKRRLEDRAEEDRRRLKEARDHEDRSERAAEAEREKRERRNGRRRERYAERKAGRDRGAERDPL